MNFQKSGSNWLFPTLILVPSFVFMCLEPTSSQYLQFDRFAINTEHELWRLVTGHFVHLSWPHWLMNALALVCMHALIAPDNPPTHLSTHRPTVPLKQHRQTSPTQQTKHNTLIFLLCAGLTGLCLDLFTPLERYVGLSGVLHGYLLYHLCVSFDPTYPSRLRYPASIRLSAIGLLCVKVLWEQSPWADTTGTAQLIGGPVAIDAHAYGSLSGLFLAVTHIGWRAVSHKTRSEHTP